jgi:hypothetical protein
LGTFRGCGCEAQSRLIQPPEPGCSQHEPAAQQSPHPEQSHRPSVQHAQSAQHSHAEQSQPTGQQAQQQPPDAAGPGPVDMAIAATIEARNDMMKLLMDRRQGARIRMD